MSALLVSSQILALLSIIYFQMTAWRAFRANQEEFRKQRDEYHSLLRHAMDTIKAKSLEERAQAVVAERQHDVQIEMMRDAWAQEKDLEPKEEKPLFVKTVDGGEIDVRDYEVL